MIIEPPNSVNFTPNSIRDSKSDLLSSLGSHMEWAMPFLRSLLGASPILLGLLITNLVVPRFMLKYWLTVQELDRVGLPSGTNNDDKDSNELQAKNPKPEPDAIKSTDAFIFAFLEPGLIPTWKVNSSFALVILLWVWFERPKLSSVLLFSVVPLLAVRNMLFRNLGYAIGFQKAYVKRMRGDRAWIVYSETKNRYRAITIALATGISIGALLYGSQLLVIICVPFIIGKMTMDMPLRKRSIKRCMKGLLSFWVLVLVSIALQSSHVSLFSQGGNSDSDSDEGKLAGGFVAGIYVWAGKMALGILFLFWSLVLETISICYRFDYQNVVGGTTNADTQRNSSDRGNLLELPNLSASSEPNISKADRTETMDTPTGALPLKPAPMFFSIYYFTTFVSWALSCIITLSVVIVDDEEGYQGAALSFVILWVTCLLMPVAIFVVAWFRGEWGAILKYEEKWVDGRSQNEIKTPRENTEIGPTNV